MDVLGTHAVAGLEAGRGARWPAVFAAVEGGLDLVHRHRALERLARPQRAAGGELVGLDEAALEQHVLEPDRPLLVIGPRQVVGGRQLLDRRPRHVNVPLAGKTHGAVERDAAAFPGGVEYRLVRLGLDLAEAVHAAHVVNAVHHAASSGRLARPVPIMELRVTSAASRSSLHPSVPAGRMGSTMKRVSAVESQTRIRVSSGSVTPKSASTPRGSLTARER